MGRKKNYDTSTLGGRIRTLRISKGLTGQELSEEMGVSTATISQWEKNINRPTPQNIEKLATVLEVEKSYILLGDKYVQFPLFDSEELQPSAYNRTMPISVSFDAREENKELFKDEGRYVLDVDSDKIIDIILNLKRFVPAEKQVIVTKEVIKKLLDTL